MKILKVVTPFILFSTIISCCDGSETFRLSETGNQFIPYEINDILFYKNIESDELIEFTVIDKTSVIFEDDNFGGFGFQGFCNQSDDSYEEKTIWLTSENCSMLYSVSVLGNPAGINFSLGRNSCDVSSFGSTNNNGENLLYQDGTYTVEGVLYDPVYELNNSSSRVLVTPGIGVLSFIDENSGQEYVFVE